MVLSIDDYMDGLHAFGPLNGLGLSIPKGLPASTYAQLLIPFYGPVAFSKSVKSAEDAKKAEKALAVAAAKAHSQAKNDSNLAMSRATQAIRLANAALTSHGRKLTALQNAMDTADADTLLAADAAEQEQEKMQQLLEVVSAGHAEMAPLNRDINSPSTPMADEAAKAAIQGIMTIAQDLIAASDELRATVSAFQKAVITAENARRRSDAIRANDPAAFQPITSIPAPKKPDPWYRGFVDIFMTPGAKAQAPGSSLLDWFMTKPQTASAPNKSLLDWFRE